MIYRGMLAESDFKTITSELVSSTVERGFGNQGRNYAILFDIQGQSQTYGMSAGTEEQADKKHKSLALTKGMVYTFYIDPTVLGGNGTNLGVTRIERDGETVYQQSRGFQIIGGAIFIFMGLIGAGLMYLLAKKKFK